MADTQTLHDLFAASFAQDQNVRMRAELDLQKLESQDGLANAVLHLVVSTSIDSNVQQAASIYLKNRICKAWETGDPSNQQKRPLGPSDRVSLKANILPALLSTPPRIQTQMKAAFDTMVRADLLTSNWPGLLDDIAAAVGQPRNQHTAGALIALGVVLNTVRYKTRDERQLIDVIVAQTFPHLVQLGSSVLTELSVDDASEHIGLMLHLIFKCYRYTIHRELSAHQRQNESIVAWGTLFLQVVNRQTPPAALQGDAEERERLEWWKAKKWSYALLNMLFARFGSPSQLSKSHMAEYGSFAQTFETHFAPEILKAYLRQVELLIANQLWLSQRCKRHIIDFLTEAVKPKAIWLLLKPHIPAILERFIFPVFCLSDEEIETFTDDPQEFVREHMAESITDFFRLPVTAGEQFLDELVKKRKQTLKDVLQFVSGVVQRYPEARSAKEKDAALRMIAGIAKQVVDSKDFGPHLEGFVTQYVVTDFASPHGFLRARACDVIDKLEAEDMQWEVIANLDAMLQGCLGLLTDRELPVRIAAALALPELSRYEQVRTILAPNIGPIAQELLASANEVEIDRLTMAIRTLFSSFTEELMPFAVQLSGQLTSTYLRLVTECVSGAAENNGDFDENKALTAMSNMRALEQLLESVEDLPEHLAQIEAQVLPAVNYTLANEFNALYDEIFEILDSLLFYQKRVSPAMWQTFEILYSCFKGDGLDYIEEMMTVWDNYVSFGSEHIIAHPNHLEALVRIVETVMVSERLGAEDRCAGCKVAESLFLNLRGHINDQIPRLLQHPLEFVFRKTSDTQSEPVVSERLFLFSLELLINAVYYNPLLALQYLAHHAAVLPFFEKWLKHNEELTRVHDRKLGILAVISILENIAQIPEEVARMAPDLLEIAISLFGGLPAAIQHRQRAEDEAIKGDDDDDDLDGLLDDDDAEDGSLGDDEDVKDDFTDELVAQIVKKHLNEEADGNAIEGDPEDDAEDLWEEEVLFTSPLDNVDVYLRFSSLLMALQQHYPAILEGISDPRKAKLPAIVNVANTGGEASLKAAKDSKNANATAPIPQ